MRPLERPHRPLRESAQHPRSPDAPGPEPPPGTVVGMARATKSPKPERDEARTGENAPNPVWFKPVMFGFMLLGLAWIIVFYVSQGTLPIPDLGNLNILIGFGIAFIGFLMTTRWR